MTGDTSNLAQRGGKGMEPKVVVKARQRHKPSTISGQPLCLDDELGDRGMVQRVDPVR